MKKNRKLFVLIFTFILAAVFIPAQNKPALKVIKVTDNLYFISGAGGNIGVLKAKDKLLLIDTGVPQTAKMVKAKIREFFKLPVQEVVNTHYHNDHTGANRILGEGKKILLQKNCLASLQKMLKNAAKGKQGEKSKKKEKLQYVSFDRKKIIKFGNETVTLVHLGPGHTCGDVIVIFEKNKAVHTGDLLFHEMPPYIDVKDGADTQNWIKIITRLAKKFPDHKVIPGHGNLTNMKGWLRFAEYLTYLRKSVKEAIAGGKTSGQAQESISFAKFPDIKDKSKFISKKNNVAWVYQELTGTKK